MITLYGMGSPNVIKIAIMLEEIGRPYQLVHVPVMSGGNFTPDFLALNPIAKVPVIVDADGPAGPDQPIFESGAILIYLAENYAPALYPASGPMRWEALKWLMVQLAWVGPMLGQNNHFRMAAGQQESYGAARYQDQAARIYRDLDARLAENAYLAGAEYSIADIATYPWSDYLTKHGFSLADHPGIAAWRERVEARPSIARAREAMAQLQPDDYKMITKATPETLDRFYARSEPGPETNFAALAG